MITRLRAASRFVCVASLGAALLACGGGSSDAPGGPPSGPAPSGTPPTPPATASPSPAPAPTPTASLSTSRWQSFGPDGGDVLDVALDPERPDVLFAATEAGAVWRSDDGARSWSRAAALPVERGAVGALAVAQSRLLAVNEDALFQSTDDGASWQQLTVPLDDADFLNSGVLAADDRPGGRIYASSGRSLFASADAGASWSDLPQPVGASLTALAVDPRDPRRLLAGQVSSGAISVDGGASWRRFNMPAYTVFGDPAGYLLAFAFDPDAPDRIWAAAGHGGIWQSDDLGRSWIARNDGIAIMPSLVYPGVRSLANAPDDAQLLLAGAGGSLYRSVDGAQRWTPANVGLGSPDVAALAFVRDRPDVVYAGTIGAGVARSDDRGLTWLAASDGLAATFVSALASDPTNGDLVIAGTGSQRTSYGPVAPGPVGRLYRSVDGGRSWGEARPDAASGEVLDVVFDPGTPQAVFAVVQHEGVLHSADGGVTWESLGSPIPPRLVGRLAVQPGGRVLLLASEQLLRSADGGASWQEVELDLELGDGEKRCAFTALAIDPHDPQRFYAASDAGVMVSADAGLSWRGPAACSVFSLPILRSSQVVLPDPTTPGRVYATRRYALIVSEDGGVSFAAPAGDLPEGAFVEGLAHDGRWLYAAVGGVGVLRSRDARRWQPLAEPPLGGARRLAVLPGETPGLAAATAGGGVALRALAPN